MYYNIINSILSEDYLVCGLHMIYVLRHDLSKYPKTEWPYLLHNDITTVNNYEMKCHWFPKHLEKKYNDILNIYDGIDIIDELFDEDLWSTWYHSDDPEISFPIKSHHHDIHASHFQPLQKLILIKIFRLDRYVIYCDT